VIYVSSRSNIYIQSILFFTRNWWQPDIIATLLSTVHPHHTSLSLLRPSILLHRRPIYQLILLLFISRLWHLPSISILYWLLPLFLIWLPNRMLCFVLFFIPFSIVTFLNTPHRFLVHLLLIIVPFPYIVPVLFLANKPYQILLGSHNIYYAVLVTCSFSPVLVSLSYFILNTLLFTVLFYIVHQVSVN